ncbi:MAG TPA: hypothetical protein DCO86_01170 [Spirochaetaceae bacterium]|nr:hypothetical protein [Spirochaetaceae bacterium]
MLTPIPAISNKEEGLKEAAECVSDYIQFSTKEKRFCEIQKLRLQDDHHGYYSHPASSDDYLLKNYFHGDRTYKKGLLRLHKITQREYDSLSEAARRWFDREVLSFLVQHGRKYETVAYSPLSKTNMSMLMEIQTKMHVKERYIPLGEKIRHNNYLEDCLYGVRRYGIKVIHEFFPHDNERCFKQKKYRCTKGCGKAKQMADRQMLSEIMETEE